MVVLQTVNESGTFTLSNHRCTRARHCASRFGRHLLEFASDCRRGDRESAARLDLCWQNKPERGQAFQLFHTTRNAAQVRTFVGGAVINSDIFVINGTLSFALNSTDPSSSARTKACR